jgi:hypothetical protein
VLGAGAIAIIRRGEKAVMAAGGGVRMVVPILHHRIGTALVVMVYFRMRDSVVVTMFIGFLVVLIVLILPIFRPVLGAHRRWRQSRQREREQTKHE